MDLTRRIALGLLAAPFLARPGAAADGILVFAAASLRQGLDAALTAWRGAPVTVSYAGTATLARQIEAGAPADLFFAANATWAAYLDEGGFFAAPPVPVLGNSLVLAGRARQITPRDIADALAALPGDARIATGFTQAVPVGIYARQTLEALDLWQTFAPRLVQVENTRIAAALATRGEVARALIYASDVAADRALAVEATVPARLHDAIIYPLAVTAAGPHPDRAALAEFLASPATLARFRAHGFTGPGA